ncbi:MAG: hypothetical protein ACLVAK_09670 [Clostridia bacterium]
MPDLDNIEKITSTLYGQIVKEQDEATMQMLENYVKEKQRSGEICLLNIIGEGKIRHIFNLGLTEYARIQKEPRSVLSKNYFPESVYVEFLQEKINKLEFENRQLKYKIEELENYEHIPHID